MGRKGDGLCDGSLSAGPRTWSGMCSRVSFSSADQHKPGHAPLHVKEGSTARS
jgi:hypothetical protein